MIERHPIAFYAHGCYVTSMNKKESRVSKDYISMAKITVTYILQLLKLVRTSARVRVGRIELIFSAPTERVV